MPQVPWTGLRPASDRYGLPVLASTILNLVAFAGASASSLASGVNAKAGLKALTRQRSSPPGTEKTITPAREETATRLPSEAKATPCVVPRLGAPQRLPASKHQLQQH